MKLTGTINIKGKELVNPTIDIDYAVLRGGVDIAVIYNNAISVGYPFTEDDINAISLVSTTNTDRQDELKLELIKTLKGHENIS